MPEADAVLPDPEAHDGAPPPGRGRPLVRRVALGVVVVMVIGAAMGGWLVTRDHTRTGGEEAAAAFVADYGRSLDATYQLQGEFTRTMPDGRELTSGLLVVQRPPDRLQRSLGSTVGVVNGRVVNCGPSGGAGGYQCAPGAVADPWEVRRAEQLDALAQYVQGDDPVYAVTTGGDGCYELVRRRTEPAASFGTGAEVCVDRATGAVRRLEVRNEGGSVDVLLGLVISGDVADADFDLSADPAYDPAAPDGS